MNWSAKSCVDSELGRRPYEIQALEMILWRVHRHQDHQGSRSYRHLCREVHDAEEMGGTAGSQQRLEKEPDHQRLVSLMC